MKKITFILLLTSIAYIQCIDKPKSQVNIQDIEGTSWSKEIAKGCISTISFLEDQKYNHFNCEMEDSLYGRYELNGQNILLIREGSIYDKFEAEDSPHRVGKAKFTLKLNDGKLFYIKREDFINDKWVESKHTFSDDYYYTQMK